MARTEPGAKITAEIDVKVYDRMKRHLARDGKVMARFIERAITVHLDQIDAMEAWSAAQPLPPINPKA